jgi:hypothetical protein
MDEQRRLLDALMGADRNGQAEVINKHFTDSDVCKHYLCCICPHELFTNTVGSTHATLVVLPSLEKKTDTSPGFLNTTKTNRKWTLEIVPKFIRQC